ncbi:peptidoglycan-binding protein [Rhodopseudomonas palustris]|uniref:Peptidoglycan-binding protein n=2 Tax=Rhodopseudomonas palustris TaxID=1076 RepID=A0A323UNL0_RHOPL|nr:peptidoglycan-binding domain-containing protein [Rhodopseudomonas palustris]PZA13220.1 peptidoglycan-binding protein [Rhodopseudomonas palustris]
MRLMLSSPKDFIAAMFASAAVIAIVTNAIFMQAGQHPSPMFGKSASLASVSIVTLPRPRPFDAEQRADTKALDQKLLEPTATELKPPESKAAEAKAVEIKPVEAKAADIRLPEPRPARGRTADSEDPLGNLVRATAPHGAAASANVPRPPAAIPSAGRDPLGQMITSSRRIAAVQRALTQYGYGQLKPTGTAGSDTHAAIARFERSRNLPVTGQVSDRVVRELGLMIGHSID